jgi:hypothetical protein
LVEARKPEIDQSTQNMSESNSLAQDITEIKAELRELSKTVQRLTKRLGLNRLAIYSQVLYQVCDLTIKTTETTKAIKVTKVTKALVFSALRNIKHIKPVLSVYTRQFIINLENKSKS